PNDNPLIVHINDKEDIKPLIKGDLPSIGERLIDEFWPGPLTLVLPKGEGIPDVTTGGLDTIALRMPDHSIALDLIAKSGLPIAAPSANLSGRPSPTLCSHVVEDLSGRVDAIIDGGETGFGLESTVLDLSREVPILLRPGGITYEELRAVIGEVEVDPVVIGKQEKDSNKALSPGMKYRHYAPKAQAILVEGEKDKVIDKIIELLGDKEGKFGVMASQQSVKNYPDGVVVKSMGSRYNLSEVGSNIFKILREFDQLDVDKIFIEGISDQGLGLAIMNRLRKATGYKIIEV
ncbi:L-threonylcarbamoyladenylate synthase, partial [Halonatronum saccharophilum]